MTTILFSGLKRFREEYLKMSVKEVAQAVGVNITTVYRFEQGKNFSYAIYEWYENNGYITWCLQVPKEDKEA